MWSISLWIGARLRHSYNGRLTGNHVWPIELYGYQWPWVCFNLVYLHVNGKVHVACDLNITVKGEVLLKVTGSLFLLLCVHLVCANTSGLRAHALGGSRVVLPLDPKLLTARWSSPGVVNSRPSIVASWSHSASSFVRITITTGCDAMHCTVCWCQPALFIQCLHLT